MLSWNNNARMCLGHLSSSSRSLRKGWSKYCNRLPLLYSVCRKNTGHFQNRNRRPEPSEANRGYQLTRPNSKFRRRYLAGVLLSSFARRPYIPQYNRQRLSSVLDKDNQQSIHWSIATRQIPQSQTEFLSTYTLPYIRESPYWSSLYCSHRSSL